MRGWLHLGHSYTLLEVCVTQSLDYILRDAIALLSLAALRMRSEQLDEANIATALDLRDRAVAFLDRLRAQAKPKEETHAHSS